MLMGVLNIIELYNIGSIIFSVNFGGIIGRVEIFVFGYFSLINCYNIGVIDGGWLVGIIGEEMDGGVIMVVNCYNVGIVDNDLLVGDFVFKGGFVIVIVINCFYDE